MHTNDWEESSRLLITLVKEYFGTKVIGFCTYSPDDQGFISRCQIYCSFAVRFSLGDVSRGGAFGIDVYIGDWPVDLETLTDWHENISLNFSKQAIMRNLEILDEYLQWRMTDAQKKTYGLI